LHGPAATRHAIRRRLKRTSTIHFACHAEFAVHHSLAAGIGLPCGETWRALEWLQEPMDAPPLVTRSACRSAEVTAQVGREVFGLVTGRLGSGVRSVVVGLWPVADRETLPLMWRFYRHRLLHDPATALALAQRETLADLAGSPLFWAPFAFRRAAPRRGACGSRASQPAGAAVGWGTVRPAREEGYRCNHRFPAWTHTLRRAISGKASTTGSSRKSMKP
jgi:hypothetical protein